MCEHKERKKIAYNCMLCHEWHTIQFMIIQFFFKALWMKISILIS